MTIDEHLEDAIAAGAPDYGISVHQRVQHVSYLPADLAALLRWAMANPEAAERLALGLENK